MLSKVVVCCPGNVVTGGPELLHQFVHELRTNNVDAEILYYPFSMSYEIPLPYKHYNVSVVKWEEINDGCQTMIVLPETGSRLARFFKKSKIAVWWLSVDNYYGHSNLDADFFHKFKNMAKIILRRKLAIKEMKNMVHFHQSEYAKVFLKSKNIKSIPMSDYLNKSHINVNVDLMVKKKEKIIAYNPKKGVRFTKTLIDRFSEFVFIPLINMSPEEVRSCLERSMIYIDFGHHPGKDRFPREAAMAGCIVITGRQGSANNIVDIPIPEKFKINELEEMFVFNFEKLVLDIFNDYESNLDLFDDYRTMILNEENKFKQNVNDFISSYISLN